MGTTSNYSWPYPEATGLVKDGWEDIKDLATAIDTTAAANFSGDLKLTSSTTIGSAVSSVVVSNCFSATYDNYLILLTNPTAFSGSNVTLQLRLRSGATSSSSDYYFIGYNGTTSALNHDTNAPSYFTIGSVSSGVPTLGGSGQIWLYQPFLAQATHSYISFMGVDTSLATRRSFSFPGFHNVATSYDSIEILCSTGTMTGGKIRVYGYKN